MGMATIDMHRLFRYNQLHVKNLTYKEVDSIGINDFTDLICGSLRKWQYKVQRRLPVGDEEKVQVLV